MNGRWAECPGLSFSSWHRWGGGSVWFVLLAVAFSSRGQDRPCSTLPGARGSGGQFLPQPVKTSHTESLPPLSAHTHTPLPGKHIHIFMSSPKRCSDSHRQEGEAVIWSKKKCVYNSSKRGKEVWGHLLCYCNLFIPLHSSLQQHVNAGYRVETKCGQKNVRESFKLTQIAIFDCLHLPLCCCSASFLFVDKPAKQWAKLYTFEFTAKVKVEKKVCVQ